ncbi:MAG: hypothetical protein CM1200mP22_03250 [Dehalococcoidia bacterium]|nr:MAG: hypothetical protein CM1200mP22_03250 [Dehalococcoidia bacterium]
MIVGGKVPVCVIQNTGMMESGDSIRGMSLDANFPLGHADWLQRLGNPHGIITDSAAKYTETFLHAMGINYYLLETDDDASRISVAFEDARKNSCPVAVLVGDEYHGFNRE